MKLITWAGLILAVLIFLPKTELPDKEELVSNKLKKLKELENLTPNDKVNTFSALWEEIKKIKSLNVQLIDVFNGDEGNSYPAIQLTVFPKCHSTECDIQVLIELYINEDETIEYCAYEVTEDDTVDIEWDSTDILWENFPDLYIYTLEKLDMFQAILDANHWNFHPTILTECVSKNSINWSEYQLKSVATYM